MSLTGFKKQQALMRMFLSLTIHHHVLFIVQCVIHHQTSFQMLDGEKRSCTSKTISRLLQLWLFSTSENIILTDFSFVFLPVLSLSSPSFYTINLIVTMQGCFYHPHYLACQQSKPSPFHLQRYLMGFGGHISKAFLFSQHLLSLKTQSGSNLSPV